MRLRNYGARGFINLVWLLGLLMQGPQAHAIIYYVSPGGSDGNAGTSWATARATVQSAMSLASVSDQIWVAAGTYLLSSGITMNNGVALYGGFNGTEHSLGQRDTVHNVTVLDGKSTYAIVTLPSNTSLRTRVDGFTFQHGSNYDIGINQGSGVVANNTLNEAGSAVIAECIWSNGDRAYVGNTVVINNNKITSSANGIDLGCGSASLSGNTVQNCGGTGIVVARGLPTVTMNNNIVTACKAGFTILAYALTFAHNAATFNLGLGMNVMMWYGPAATFIVADNLSASNGAGGLNCFCCNSTMIIRDNLIADNGNTTNGGGILIDGTYGPFVLMNNTIVDNAAGTPSGGGGVYLKGGAGTPGGTVANNLVAFNTSGIDTDGSNPANVTLTTNDVFGSDFNNYDNLSPGASDISADPLFVDQIDHDYHLTAASPCIDTGADGFVAPGDVDVDGNPRIYGAHVDIGGYEWAPSAYPVLAALAVSPSTLCAGQSASGLITLTSAALPGGATIQVSSSNPAALSVPSSVTVPAGSNAVLISMTASALTVPQAVTISAAYRGVTQSAVVTVNPLIASLTLSPPVVIGGAASTGTLTLNGSNPSALTVTLTSSDASVTVPASITVAAGATFATFPVTTTSVTAVRSVTLTAVGGVQTLTAPLNVDPSATLKNLTITPGAVTGGLTATGVVTLTAAAPTGGIVIPIANSAPTVAVAPVTVTIPAGKRSVAFLIPTGVVSASTTATLTAALGSVAKTAKLTVTPATIASLTLMPSTVQGGENSIGIVTLSMPAPSPVVVTLSGGTVASPDVTSIVIPTGAIQGLFNISTVTVTAQTSVTMKTTAYGVAKTATLTVTP